MKKVFFTLTLISLITNFVGVCVADDMQRYKEECMSFIEKPIVKVTSSYGKLIYNFDKDRDFLLKETIKKFKDGNVSYPKEFYPAGLTKVRDGFDFKMDVGAIEVSHGKMCLYPRSISAHLGYYVPVIYILKDLKKDSCMYSLVLRHEKTHMQIYLEALDYFLPIFKKSVDALFDNIGVEIVDKSVAMEDAAQAYNNQYLEIMQKKLEKWRKEVEKEQLKLDTMENYMLESKICAEIDSKD